MKHDHMKQNNISPKKADAALRQAFKVQLPESPESPWFSRKVMNRLPEPTQQSGTSIMEIVCYVIAALGLIAAWGYAVHATVNHGLTPQTIALAGIVPLVSLFCIGLFAIPALKRSL